MNRTTLARYDQGLPGEQPTHPILLPNAWNLLRNISLLAQEINLPIRIKTEPDYDSNLHSSAFTLGRNPDSSLAKNQAKKSLEFCQASPPPVNSSGLTSGLIYGIR